jgi:hypothetical protein
MTLHMSDKKVQSSTRILAESIDHPSDFSQNSLLDKLYPRKNTIDSDSKLSQEESNLSFMKPS